MPPRALPAIRSSQKKFFSSTLILANGPLSEPVHPLIVQDMMKDGQGLRAPGIPTPICRIEVVKAATSPSLSAKSHRETHFLKKLFHLNGPDLFGVNLLPLVRDEVFCNVSCDFLHFRQQTDPLIVIELL